MPTLLTGFIGFWLEYADLSSLLQLWFSDLTRQGSLDQLRATWDFQQVVTCKKIPNRKRKSRKRWLSISSSRFLIWKSEPLISLIFLPYPLIMLSMSIYLPCSQIYLEIFHDHGGLEIWPAQSRRLHAKIRNQKLWYWGAHLNYFYII